MARAPAYKPLLFTTTVRSPERLKGFLGILKAYNEKCLNDDLATEIAGELIRQGLYKPRNLSAAVKGKHKQQIPLSDKEVKQCLRDNPQQHKEAGFNKGWPSRFDTWFKFAKELGFVYYKPGQNIVFSEIGGKLAEGEEPGIEQQAFLNAFVKYQSNSPFRRVLNENAPLILLLQVITKLNADPDFNGSGISRSELPLLLYWKDSDAEALYQRIKRLREKFKYSPSEEAIIEICQGEIMEGKDIKYAPKTITTDYPDEFIRKMRLTGLISLRGGGRFVDINANERAKVDYVLKNYAHYSKYDTESSYFQYISTVDESLVSFSAEPVSVPQQEHFLEKWLAVYPWSAIKHEIRILATKRASQDGTLKYLPAPVRLEFLIALAIKSIFSGVRVVPNYPVDDEGLPTHIAGGQGDQGDIECFEQEDGILVEVTMSGGRAQTVMEVWPIARHLEKFSEKASRVMCHFVAPGIYTDSRRQIEFLRTEENLPISARSIQEFLDYLESSATLYEEE